METDEGVPSSDQAQEAARLEAERQQRETRRRRALEALARFGTHKAINLPSQEGLSDQGSRREEALRALKMYGSKQHQDPEQMQTPSTEPGRPHNPKAKPKRR